MENVLEKIQYYYENRGAYARAWRNRGRKVVGYMCNSVPEELIIAARALPVRLSGTPGHAIDTMTSYVGSTGYAEGFMATMLNDLVTHGFDYLDFLVLPQTRNTEESQYGHLEMIRTLWPETELPPIHKIDETQTWSNNSVEHYTKQLRRFREKLEEWTGYCVSDRVIIDAIEVCNENRTLLKKVQDYRVAGKVSGTEMLQIIGCGWFIEKELHNQYLRMFLREVEARPTINGKPVYVDASPLDNLQLYSLIEEKGGHVVDEDNCWGMRSVEDMVDLKRFPDPIVALAQRYHYRKPCPYLYFPQTARCDYCREKLVNTAAKGIICYVSENDAGQCWDYAAKKDTLASFGLPVLPLLNKPYVMSDREELGKQISDFLASL